MQSFTFSAQNLSQRFQHRQIFNDISFKISNKEVLGITGHNGSGKTTLVKIIAGLISPNSGSVQFVLNNLEVDSDDLYLHIGFVSPYLTLYEEFTALELLKIIAQMRGMEFDAKFAEELLADVHLIERKNDEIKTYSSGMKQRMKYACALLHKPCLLIVDEPMTNLDNDGMEMVERIILNHSQSGGGVILATNDQRDVKLCSQTISVEDFLKKR